MSESVFVCQRLSNYQQNSTTINCILCYKIKTKGRILHTSKLGKCPDWTKQKHYKRL